MRRLLELEVAGQLRTQDLRLVATGQSVSTRTVRRWLEVARAAGTSAASSGRRERRDRFVVTAQVRERLAFWRGNVAAVHRELIDAQTAGGAAAPSLAALHRAIQRDVLPHESEVYVR